MNEVFLHRSLAPDQKLGVVMADGRVYETRFGPDKLVGHVELSTGRVYESRFGPDRTIGRVNLLDGKVYLSRVGPDVYIGEVHRDGRLTHHKRMAADDYIGKVRAMSSLAHGGAAYLLLVLPEYEKLAGADQDAAEPDTRRQGKKENR